MKDDGGAAFPNNSDHRARIGMTLRDWFAGQAMKDCPVNAYEHEEAAKWCYDRANAMIAERNKGE